MRFGGAALFLLGLVALVVCTLNGCGTFFTWNGRNPIASVPLPDGQTHHSFTPWGGRRYTLAVQAVFDPAHVADRDGMAAVEARMSLVVRVKDKAGTTLAETVGWLDPNERPNVFYSRPLHAPARVAAREIAVERLTGPFLVASDTPLDVDVDLGPDRVGRHPLLERRLVIHDDALPPAIRNAAIGAVVASLSTAAGFVLLLLGWWRGRRRRKRSGVPRESVV
ncbi:MAG: hypothetical protein KIT84_15175 [Labilithrix sp.]|nr:hypothetical protein [Labilithrix sp.]MCW5812366.1 hypothetical protein [Labilithrix sp.]